MPTHD